MDFNKLEISHEPTFLQFRHPGTHDLLWEKEPVLNAAGEVTEEGDPVGVYIYSADSEQYQKLQRILLDKRLEDAQQKQKLKPTAEEIERQGMATLVACIHAFKNIQMDGDDLGSNRPKFPEFLTKHKWAREQIDRSVVDRQLFLKASSKS